MSSRVRSRKKGISVMIGYVILISVALVMGAIVFAWIRSYVPAETAKCPDGTSLFIKSSVYDCDLDTLSFTIKNNGRFNVAGYFIHASNKTGQELAIIDLTEFITEGDPGPIKLNTGVKFHLSGENTVAPGEEADHEFSSLVDGDFYFLEIVPIRYQKDGVKTKVVSCSNSRIKYFLSC